VWLVLAIWIETSPARIVSWAISACFAALIGVHLSFLRGCDGEWTAWVAVGLSVAVLGLIAAHGILAIVVATRLRLVRIVVSAVALAVNAAKARVHWMYAVDLRRGTFATSEAYVALPGEDDARDEPRRALV